MHKRQEFNNNGVYPPDLSVIAKARKNGVDYLYNLLLGYTEAPENFEIGEGMYYNQWINGQSNCHGASTG